MPLSNLIPSLIGGLLGSPADEPPKPPPAVMQSLRTVPAEAKLGEMAPPEPGTVRIDGKVLPLSVAAQIRNEANLIVMPTSIRQPVRVRYLNDATGAVWRVWILTPAELSASR